jgi:hypothetical protein
MPHLLTGPVQDEGPSSFNHHLLLSINTIYSQQSIYELVKYAFKDLKKSDMFWKKV